MADGSIFRLTNPEIYVVTTAQGDQRAGQVATWVTLATLVPESPRVLVVLSPHTHTSSILKERQSFVLNMLADDQESLLETFGIRSGFNHQKFTDVSVTHTDSGLPILPETCGWALCEVSQQIDVGDRIIWVADVVKQSVNPNKSPLRRVEGLNALPDEVRQELLQQRLADIERDRPLRNSSNS